MLGIYWGLDQVTPLLWNLDQSTLAELVNPSSKSNLFDDIELFLLLLLLLLVVVVLVV